MTNYVDLLQELKRMRNEAMKPIVDRKLRLFIINHQNVPLSIWFTLFRPSIELHSETEPIWTDSGWK